MVDSIKGRINGHNCGELREENSGTEVVLCGWVNKSRDLGGIHFIDIRDKYGVTQLNFEDFKGDLSILKDCSLESVIRAKGLVRVRPDSAQNRKMETGMVELLVSEIEVMSQSDKDNIPFLPYGQVGASDDLKLKYRYLDLRTKKLQDMLKLRSQTTFKVRNVLMNEDFVEVETPMLYKSTPEGARDYIVPSRVHPSQVYALPQSPQTLKQLLMIGGTDKYFQICKCFRDEDLRSDRQPEFTQIDMEISFATPEYIKNLIEKLLAEIFGLKDGLSIPVMGFDEAMDIYGCDKPDARFELKHMKAAELFKSSEFKVFSGPANSGGLVKAIFLPESMGTMARKDIDALVEVVRPYGGKGVAWFKTQDGKRTGGVSKFITDEIYSGLDSMSPEKGNGLWMFFADMNHEVAHASADAVRRFLGNKFELHCKENVFLWINDFPLFEWSEEAGRFAARHHPFTQPKACDLEKFLNGAPGDKNGSLSECKADAYDVVCNGYELGGGSIRIYDNKIQSHMFKCLNMTDEEIDSQFGFFINALKFGVPPHGGLAFGLDRIMMILMKTEFIKDVIAFPKTNSATDMMAGSPSRPAAAQLEELHFNWNQKEKK
ncbi:MAG: aspartate--tRNA ligase [Bacteriovoracaceae bacterium]|nr:aspartate--tRNA ligase [Bacteriovoracaceae bacterium]